MNSETIAARLRTAREQALGGISQERLAQILRTAGYDVTGATVMRYESGRREAPGEYLRTVALVSGVDPGWLLSGQEGEPNAEPIASSPVAAVDLWGMHRARAVERLADLLLQDQKILELRAEAAVLTARAALVDAETASGRGGEPAVSAATAERLFRVAEAEQAARGVADPESPGGAYSRKPGARD
jgi:transcriptional regulator with XRE-family HTH domain